MPQYVTPAQAEEWLKRLGPSQRPVDWQFVQRLEQIILAGEWECEAHNPVTFDREGRLTNGQHRLWAIVISQRTVPLYIDRQAEKLERVHTAAINVLERSEMHSDGYQVVIPISAYRQLQEAVRGV